MASFSVSTYGVLSLFLLAAAGLDDSTPEGAWKLRALKAAHRLEEKPQTCEKALETAYTLHLTEEKLVKKANDEALFFHLILTAPKNEVFDFAYVYNRKRNEVVGARVTDLPKKWMLAFADANKVIVRTDAGCTYELDLKDPFVARVLLAPPKN